MNELLFVIRGQLCLLGKFGFGDGELLGQGLNDLILLLQLLIFLDEQRLQLLAPLLRQLLELGLLLLKQRVDLVQPVGRVDVSAYVLLHLLNKRSLN